MAIRYLSGINVDSNTLFVDSTNNRVGIGTGSPVSSLNINNGDAWINVTDTLRGLQFGYAGPSHGSYRAAVMGGAESYGGTDSGMLTFHTQNGYVVSAIPPERMRITSSGNVGIGITSASERLTVVSSGAGISAARFTDANRADIVLSFPSNGVASIDSYQGASDGALAFRTAANERMRITSTGNVGIGTTSPQSKLQIGTTNFSIADRTSAVYGAAASETIFTVGISGVDYPQLLNFGVNQVGLYSTISARQFTVATENKLVLQPNGGNVGIGTTSPGAKLEIAQNTDNTDGPTLRIANNANTLSNGQLIGAIDFYNGDDSGTGNAVGAFIRSFTADAVLPVSSQYLSFAAGGTTERMRIASTGATRLNAYGSGSFTGTVAYNLAVDSSGNIIETAGGVVDGSGTANYVTKWQDANTVTNSQIVDNGTNVGVNNASPKTKLDVNGTIGFGSKSLNISDTFVTVLTVNMSNHTGCYVKITAFGDWSGHSAVAYLGEFFLQNGASAYNEPGVIIRQVDNTNTDDVVAQIVDPAGTGTRDFEIQLKTTSASGVPFSAAIQYEVRGQYNSVS